MMTERKHSVINAAKTICFILSLILLVSCSGDDDCVKQPITLQKELEQVLNSASASDFTCISATITGKKLNYADCSRLYPNRRIDMWIGFSTEEDYHPDVDGNILNNLRYADLWDDNSFTCHLFNLKPSTTYLFNVVYSVDSVCFYGDVQRFTTESADKYLSMKITKQDFTSVILEGETLMDDIVDGDYLSIEYKEINQDYYPLDYILPTRNGNKLSAIIDNLRPATEYEYWLFSTGGKGSAETSKQTFKTPSPAEYISIDNISNINGTSVEVSVSLDPKVFKKMRPPIIYCGTNKDELNRVSSTSFPKGDNSFTLTINRLEPNTTYYYIVGVMWDLSDSQSDWYFTEPHSFVTASDSGESE